MGIWSKFQAIFAARANQAADALEDPKASLDYSLGRLEDTRAQIVYSLVEVSAAQKRLETQRDEARAAISRYQDQAQAAVQAGREDLARLVLQRQQDAGARQAALEAQIANLDLQVNSLKESQFNLEHKIALFRSKKEELKAIYDSSRAQLEVRAALAGISQDLNDVAGIVQRVEARIQEMQSRAAAIEGLASEGALPGVLGGSGDEVDRQLYQIARSQAVEDELLRLKAGQVRLLEGDEPAPDNPA